MNSEYECLLYHTEVRWLSKGEVLRCMCLLIPKITFVEIQKRLWILFMINFGG